MDWREFIASLVGSLAWPVAIVAVVWLFRKQLAPLLDGPLTRLSIGPFQAEWDLNLATARTDVKALQPPPTAEDQDDGADAPRGTGVADLWPLVETAPSAAVLEGFARVEYALAKRLESVANVPPVGGMRLARLAQEHGVISEATVRAVDGLVVLRNLAAHRRADRVVTSEEAGEFLSLVEAVLYAIG